MEDGPAKQTNKNKQNKKTEKSHTEERVPTMPERERNGKNKQPEEKEATRNVKKGRTTLKRSKWRKA